ncbi:hypothetical protein K492DRAFT_200286 [Lichtheimia hyalospora FSU 10163]|nr:hypothetical protein K492DRAFT_200286 [Lichtheimia hyalospora FSU 10163]
MSYCDLGGNQRARLAHYIRTLVIEMYAGLSVGGDIVHDTNFPCLTRLEIKDVYEARVFEIGYGSIGITGLPHEASPLLKALRIYADNQSIHHGTNPAEYPSMKYLQYRTEHMLLYWDSLPLHCPPSSYIEGDLLPIDAQPSVQRVQMHDRQGSSHDPRDIEEFLNCNHDTVQVPNLFIGSHGTEVKISFPRLHYLTIQPNNPVAQSYYGWWDSRVCAQHQRAGGGHGCD